MGKIEKKPPPPQERQNKIKKILKIDNTLSGKKLIILKNNKKEYTLSIYKV